MGPWAFPAIYLGWAYLFWLPLFISDESVWALPNLFFFLLGGASPLIAAVALTARKAGMAGLRDLGWRLIDLRRIPLRWLAIVLLFWPVFDLVMSGVAVLAGWTGQPFEVEWGLLAEPQRLAFLLLLSFVFPAVEEIGLRGYWVDELQQRFSPVASGIVNGCGWALWHAPFVWFPGYYANTTFNPELWWWLPSIVIHALLLVWVYMETGRSILAAVLFHAMMNLTGEFLGLAPEMFPFLLSGHLLIAGVLVLTWRRSGCCVLSAGR